MRWINQVRRWAFKVPLFWVAISALCGVVASDGEIRWPLVLLTLIVALPPIIRLKFRFFWALVVVAVFLGFAGLHHRQVRIIESFPLASSLNAGAEVRVKGKGWVCSDTGQKAPTSYRGVVALDDLWIRDKRIPLLEPQYLVADIQLPQATEISYGDEIVFSGKLSKIEPATSPGAFDPAAFYFRSASAIAQLEVRPGDTLEIKTDQPRGSWLRRSAIASRKWMEKGLRHGIAGDDESFNGIVQAMVLGSREKSPEEVEEWFRLSGTMHIFAVSGLHVGVIALLLWWVLKWTGLTRISAVYIVIPAVLFYAILTGLRPSSFRAAVMLSVFLAGFAFRQRPSPLNALGVAALILMAIDTQQVFLPGFQLSFCVVVTLIIVATALSKCLHAPFEIDAFLPRKRIAHWRISMDKCLRFFTGAAAISIASWVGSFLLMDSHFEGVSPIGLIANIFMVPIAASIVTIAGIALACYGVKLGFFTFVLNQVNLALVTLLTAMAQFFAGLPGSHIHTGEQDTSITAPPVTLEVMGIDGDSATLLTNIGRHWLIDSGGQRTFSSQVLPLLRNQGINQIDGLILSHGDSGHIGATPYLLNHLPPKILIESRFPNKARSYKEIDRLLQKQSIEQLRVQAPQRLLLDSNTYWEILYPGVGDPPTGVADDRCLVMRLRTGHWRILFTFDSGFLVEKELVNQKWNLKSDIWIRGQHTKTRSATLEFLEQVSPKVIITSEAEFPPHERLHPNWVKLVERRGVELVSLLEAGSVRIEVDDRNLRLIPFVSGEPKVFSK